MSVQEEILLTPYIARMEKYSLVTVKTVMMETLLLGMDVMQYAEFRSVETP